MAGGVFRNADGGIVGEGTVDLIKQFKVDYAVIGASALDEDGAVLDFDIREVSVARTIISNARQTILVGDAGKFQRTAPVRICDVADVSAFVTDHLPPARFRNRCEAVGVELIVAGDSGEADGSEHG